MKSIIRQTISLQELGNNSNILTLIPRQFTITTNSNSAFFNIYILANTSSVISKFIEENPNIYHYHLDIEDEENVLGKLEILFNGSPIKFNKQDFIVLLKIIEKLSLTDFLDILNRTTTFIGSKSNIRFYYDNDSSSIKMDFASLNRFIKSDTNNKFTIKTKKNEYKCNFFGILYSNFIRELLLKDPKLDHYDYDYDDEENEFQFICNIFNFQNVVLTRNNAYSIKEISEDFQINSILNNIDKYIVNNENVSEAIDNQQEIIDKIDELFDLLYHIKEITVDSVVDSIKNSRWSKSEENVYDLASFIFQVANTNIHLHEYLIDLLLKLDENDNNNKSSKLKLLLPFVLNHLVFLLPPKFVNASNDLIYGFIFKIYKRGIIPKDKICEKLKDYFPHNPFFVSWFLPELIEVNENIEKVDFSKGVLFIKRQNQKSKSTCSFYSNRSNNIEEYRQIRDKCDYCDDIIIKALREDDVDTFQSIVSKDIDALLKNTIDANMFENFTNSKTRYLNYAAAYGSIKCFKYLLLNNENADSSTFEMAIIGGNNELIRIVDNEKIEIIETKSSYYREKYYNYIVRALSKSIKIHRNDLFDWIFEKYYDQIKQEESLKYLIDCSITNGNAHSLVQFIDAGFSFHNSSYNYSQFIENSFRNGYYLFSIFLIKLINKNSNQIIQIDPESLVFFDNTYIFKLFLDKLNSDDISKALSIASNNNTMNIIKYFFGSLFYHENLIDSNSTINLLKNCIQSKLKGTLDYLINDVNILNRFNIESLYSLLNECQKSNYLELTKKISELIYNENKNNDFTNELKCSAGLKQIEIVKFYLDNKYSIDYENLVSEITSIDSIGLDTFSLIFDNIDSFMQEKIVSTIDDAINAKNKPLIEFLLNKNAPLDDALIQAVKTNELEIVELILNKNSEPSYVNKCIGNETALLNAVDSGNDLILKRLLSIPGINPSIYNKNLMTPLLYAVKKNKSDYFIEIFKFYGDDIKHQKTQLEKAIKIMIDSNSRNLKTNDILSDIIKLKIIDPNIRTSKNTLLTYLCSNCSIDLVQTLIEYDSIDVNLSIPENGNTPLIVAVKSNKNDIVNLLLNHPKTNINQKNYAGYSPLIYLILNPSNNYYNYSSRRASKKLNLEFLINNEKFDPEESNINLAFYLSPVSVSSQLMSFKSIDVNYVPFQTNDLKYYKKNGIKIVMTSLRKAIMNNNMPFFDLIIKHPSFVKNKNQLIYDIQIAFYENNIEFLNKLFEMIDEFDVDINSPIFNGNNALIESIVSRSKNETTSFILNSPKFDSNKSDLLKAFILSYDRKNPLYKSTENNKFNLHFIDKTNLIYEFDCQHEHLIDNKISQEGNSFFTSMYTLIFTDNGIDPNKLYDFGYPLQCAIESNSYILFLCLLKSNNIDFKKQIKVNQRSKQSYTTYANLAASFGRIKLLHEILSNHLIDVNVTNDLGETPLMSACIKGQIECIKYLFTIDDLNFLHKNKFGEDAIEMTKILLNENKNETKKEIINKDEYLAELLRLVTQLNNLNDLKKQKRSKYGLYPKIVIHNPSIKTDEPNLTEPSENLINKYNSNKTTTTTTENSLSPSENPKIGKTKATINPLIITKTTAKTSQTIKTTAKTKPNESLKNQNAKPPSKITTDNSSIMTQSAKPTNLIESSTNSEVKAKSDQATNSIEQTTNSDNDNNSLSTNKKESSDKDSSNPT